MITKIGQAYVKNISEDGVGKNKKKRRWLFPAAVGVGLMTAPQVTMPLMAGYGLNELIRPDSETHKALVQLNRNLEDK